MKNIKTTWAFLKDNKQVIYSIALMVVIPGILIFNTWVFSEHFKDVVNMSLQNKAINVGEAFNAGVADKIDSLEEVQLFVNNWKYFNEDTKSLDVLLFENGSFRKIASMNQSESVGEIDNNYSYFLSWNEDNPVAQKVFESGHTYWLVTMPLQNFQGENKAILSIKVSADMVSTKLAMALGDSFWILLLGVIFIVLLLLVNSNLFEYSILYNKIKEVDKMKDEFISMASHELRTPVTIIKGYIEMIIEESSKNGLDKSAKDYLTIINSSTKRLGDLIEDLLNVSRIEQGRLKIEMKDFKIIPIIDSTIKEINPQAKEKGLSLNFIYDDKVNDLISIDEDKLKQILINIIGNSIKYTEKGSIDVKISNKNNNLILAIKDTGIGMSAKARSRLFEKFYRVINDKTENIVGTGLGLWITKQIVEAMKGTISIDSIESVGTQVTIEFPLLKNK